LTEEQHKQSSAVTAILEKLTAIDEKLRTLILVTEDIRTPTVHEGSATEREEPTQPPQTAILPAEFAADYEVRGNAYFLKEKLPPEQWNKHYAWFTEHGFAWSPKQMLWWKPKEKRE